MVDKYEEWVKNFVWDVPEYYSIADVVDEHAKDRSKVAIYFEDAEGRKEKVTYWELRDESNRFGNFLRSLGMKKGDRIMVILPRLPEVFASQLGSFKIGAIVVPCPDMLRAKDIEYRANNCQAKTIIASIASTEEVEKVRDKIPVENYIVVGEERDGWFSYEKEVPKQSRYLEKEKIKATDIMTINYTSGTTGDPKGVMHDHKWIYCMSKTNAVYWWNAKPDELLWATTSPGWAKWFWSPIGVALATGASQLIYNGRFNPAKYLELMEKYRVNRLCATPTEYRMWIQEDLESYDLRDMKKFLSAGEALNREVMDRFYKAYGVKIYDGYGQTETTGLVCNYDGIEIKPGSMGKPMPGADIKLVDENGKPVPVGQVGQIAVPITHPGLMVGYWNGKKLEELAINGLYLTGDLARMDEDGYIWFEGRADDVIKSSGYRIGPFEVEDALVKHPAVLEAAVVASPDKIRGNIVKAFIVLAKGYKPSEELIKELQNFVKQQTAPYKYPREIEFVESLPKTISGKIRRVELREMEKKRKMEMWAKEEGK
ncbi:MAG: AMP-dependent synthetase [Thermoplasmata archaeon]|nr:MAG: AMP-dependent synthetase [Thermoplasmata archaeon]